MQAAPSAPDLNSVSVMWRQGLPVLCLLVTSVAAVPSVVPLGGIFPPESGAHQDIAFRYAADRINMDKTVLPDSTLVPVIVNVSETNSLLTGRRLCNLTGYGVAAVFGPRSPTTAGIVRGICDNLEIPNLATFWEAEPSPSKFLLNLHPDPQSLAKALQEVVTHVLHWSSYVILYEHDEGLIRLQEVLKAHGPDDIPVTVKQLAPDGDNRPLMKEIQKSQVTHVILDCEVNNILGYLRQAKTVNMLQDYVNYFITSLDGSKITAYIYTSITPVSTAGLVGGEWVTTLLRNTGYRWLEQIGGFESLCNSFVLLVNCSAVQDTHTVDLSEFKDSPINITALQIVDPKSTEVINAVEDWKYGEMRKGHKLLIEANTVKTETALMYDAVNLFARSLHQLDSSQHITIKKMSCSISATWQHGFPLLHYMKLMQIVGMTGQVQLNPAGRRVDFKLNLVEYTKDEFKKIGTWDLQNGVTNTRTSSDINKQVSQNMQNKTFIVTSRTGMPYLGLKMPTEGRVGNDRFEGYSFDLISKIAEKLKIKFEFYLTEDNSYPGLIKDLQNKRADLAICDLTITYEREQIVDFTMPFMDLGISILYAKPTIQHPSLFSFLDPLSTEVWLFMATFYLAISILLYIMARASSAEWTSAHPCLAEPEELENQMTMINSLWHNAGSMLQQGSDIAPQAVSTRALAASWWFFILIMVSSYIANLTASLTLTRSDNAIESVDDLAMQTKIKYGTVRKGSTRSFFQNSNQSTYQRMYTAMVEARPSAFAGDNTEGVERVKKGKRLYAFFMESTQIEYETERNCNLTKVGGQLDRKGYGIALPLHSPYRTLINGAVLHLQETGVLSKLKNKWWKEKGGGGSCKKTTEVKVSDTELGMPSVGGVFLVLLMGCVTALFVAVLEMLWNCRKIAVQEAITPWEALVLELKFAIRMSETKPVRKKLTARLDKSKTSSANSLNFNK